MSGKKKIGIKFHSKFLVSQTEPRGINTSDLSMKDFLDLPFTSGHHPCSRKNLNTITKSYNDMVLAAFEHIWVLLGEIKPLQCHERCESSLYPYCFSNQLSGTFQPRQ